MKSKVVMGLMTLALVLTLGCGRAPGDASGPSSANAPHSDDVRAQGFAPNGVGWMLTGGALRTTANSGDVWSSIPLPSGSQDWRAGVVISDDSALVGGLTDKGGKVALTTSHGRSWNVSLLATSIANASGDIAVAFDGSVGAALVRFMTGSNFAVGEIFSTSDGVTWTRHKAPTAGRLGITPPGTLWIAGGPRADQLWVSHDVGASWNQVLLSVGATQIGVDVPHALPNSTLILPVTDIASNGLAEELFLESVDGVSWKVVRRIPTNARGGSGAILPASVSEAGLYVVEPGGSKTYFSRLSGAAQETYSSGLPEGVTSISFNARGVGWARVDHTHCASDKRTCSSLQATFRTLDSGQHWERFNY